MSRGLIVAGVPVLSASGVLVYAFHNRPELLDHSVVAEAAESARAAMAREVREVVARAG